jgi:leucine-rich repeat protein SHOC2
VGNDFKSIGNELSHAVCLQKLDLRCNFLTTLPPEIGNLTALRHLLLRNNCLTSLPAELGNLSELLELSLGNNKLTVRRLRLETSSIFVSRHVYGSRPSCTPSPA